MDSERFDQFARMVAGVPSRRSLVRLAAGGALAALLAGPAGEATARVPKAWAGRKCKDGKTCYGGSYCHRKRCRCHHGKYNCRGWCVPEGSTCDDGCLPARRPCFPTDPDPCCGRASTCTGTYQNQTVCCGVSEVHKCDTPGPDPYCCSGECQATDPPRCA